MRGLMPHSSGRTKNAARKPGRIEIETQSAESNAQRVTVTLRWLVRTVVAVKLRARTTMALLPTRRRSFAVHWWAGWWTWSAKALTRRHATFKATIRPLPHHRRTMTLLIAA